MSVQAEWPLVLHIFIGNGSIPVSEIKQPSDNDSYAHADREKDAIRRKGNQHRQHDHGRDYQASGAFHVDGHPGKHEPAREIVVREEMLV